ncbi:DMT family transporter [Mesorhizobium sp.]|uniref:DMT family transporter n=1 Tax=Mesorhizobium sp. TaxID=1871066 RepID=UPI000FE96C0E|nr:DMT family transporter [Mesorhizobium sp.]RWK47481.1 MAG: DMT family transporter [Mesorhizobium sp.]
MTTTQNNKVSQNSYRPMLLLAAAMAISGTAGVFSVQTGQPTFNVVFFRCLFGAISLTGWCLFRGTFANIAKIDRSLWILTVASGLCLVLNWAALFQAFRLISIGFTTIIYHLQPFWIVVAGALFLGEPLSRDRLAWLLLAFVGLTFVVWPRLGSIMGDATWASGLAYAVLASLLYAGSTLTARRLKAIDPAVLTIIHCVLGLLIFAPFVSVASLQTAALPVWGWLAGLGMIHTGLVYVLLYSNYPKVQTAVIAVCAFLNPAAALLCDYLVFGKSITLVQVAGVSFILLAGLGVTLSWKIPLRKAALSSS